jgi:predicted aldo/keto reductase-like oxidoreductase
MLGRVIRDVGARDDAVICTKINLWERRKKSMTPVQVKRAHQEMLEESLRRLQMDHVDILLLHGATSVEHLQDDAVLEAFQELKRQGKTRAIGLSGCQNMADVISEATRLSAHDVILTGFHFGMWEDRKMIHAVSQAAERGIGIIAMKTQCAFDSRVSQLESYQKYTRGMLMQTALLKWVLRHPFITAAIPGYSNFNQMEEDLSVAYDLEYTPEEKAFLDRKGVVYALGVCRQCGQCLPQCPHETEIPTLMRVHRYAAGYSNFDRARFVLGQIAPLRGLRQCLSCNRCTIVCPNHIDVPQRIEELKLMYA